MVGQCILFVDEAFWAARLMRPRHRKATVWFFEGTGVLEPCAVDMRAESGTEQRFPQAPLAGCACEL